MQAEYEAIVGAGFLLQIDAPDFGMGRHTMYRNASVDEYLEAAARHVEVLNHALRNLPAERMRMHICWGNYEGPHHHDVPLEQLLPVVIKAKPQALLFEAANPRHAHEWAVFTRQKVPDDKILVPGVLSTTTNYVEHPELVAERIVRFAEIVGRERVIAGTDCGFGTFGGLRPGGPGHRLPEARLAGRRRAASPASGSGSASALPVRLPRAVPARIAGLPSSSAADTRIARASASLRPGSHEQRLDLVADASAAGPRRTCPRLSCAESAARAIRAASACRPPRAASKAMASSDW